MLPVLKKPRVMLNMPAVLNSRAPRRSQLCYGRSALPAAARPGSSYSVFTNTTMAASEVIELDSGSSDDDFQEPPRKPIGWNYQLTASKKDKFQEKTGKANGAVHKTDDQGDDLEIVEVKSDKIKLPKGTVFKPLPISSTRSEIRKIIRNTSQSTISDFFVDAKKNNNSESTKTDGNESDDCEKEETVKSNSLPESDRKKYVKTEDKKSDRNADRKEDRKEDKREETKDRKEDKKAERKEEKNESTKEDNKDDTVEENSETSIASLENFVSRWEEVKSSKDDHKIRDKLWKYYYLSHSSYTHSRKFINMIESATRKLSIDNIYVVIKDILDSLKRYKDAPFGDKKQRISGEESTGEGGVSSPLPEETEEEKKRASRLRKVEKKMKEISDKIKELESSEVDLDDEANSSYLVEERLKRQFTKLHDYYCKIAQCSPATGRPIERKFRYQGSRWSEVNKRITAWVNKTKEFPDYVDILNLLKKVTKQSSLPLRPETVRVQAQEIFRDVGRMLKERRESDDLYNIYSYADDDVEDPAIKDEDLNQQLTENESIAKDKLEKIFQEFVDKDAEARENTDKNIEKNKKSSKEDNDKEEIDTNQEVNVGKEELKEGIEGEEDQEIDDDGDDDIDDVEADDDEEDEDEDYDLVLLDEETEVQNIQENKLLYDDDGDITDDDLKNVLASVCFDEEVDFSEEDVPLVDSEEMDYLNTEADDDSEVVCLDDNDDNNYETDEGKVAGDKFEGNGRDLEVKEAGNRAEQTAGDVVIKEKEAGEPTSKESLPLSKPTSPLCNQKFHSEKRKLEDLTIWPEKKHCSETSFP
ncbi:death domain-associated protein 6 [Procambarus clarkii]|uniref:death domain-associated protein 6 n=1 Tax=Procambarus clarkii TaxID=6728 RepID=UPI0037428722